MNDTTPEMIKAQSVQFQHKFDLLKSEVQKMIVGQDELVERVLIAIIAGGHVLLEGVPGLGKTMLVRSLSQALSLQFSRIQFTPDLMPADLMGTNLLVEEPGGGSRFEFSPGPIFTHLLLADEINRATPKTQSALLEVMQERSVTVSNTTHHLQRPFFVLATQNPLEMEGTYPLPEAQLDRFFFKLKVRFPSLEQLEQILDRTTSSSFPELRPVLDANDLNSMGDLVRDVPVAPPVRKQIAELVLATHPESNGVSDKVKRYVRFGASPRAAQALTLAAKIYAVRSGRFHVATEDILLFAEPVLAHRIALSFEAQADGVSIDQILASTLEGLKKSWKSGMVA